MVGRHRLGIPPGLSATLLLFKICAMDMNCVCPLFLGGGMAPIYLIVEMSLPTEGDFG